MIVTWSLTKYFGFFFNDKKKTLLKMSKKGGKAAFRLVYW